MTKNSHPIDQIKALRKRTSALIIALEQMSTKSTETTLSMHSLQMAKGHMGKMLSFMGIPNPYNPAANRRRLQGSREIPPEVDRAQVPFLVTGDPIRDADKMREEVESIRTGVGMVTKEFGTMGIVGEAYNYSSWADQHLTEARFWLGYELGRLRDDDS